MADRESKQARYTHCTSGTEEKPRMTIHILDKTSVETGVQVIINIHLSCNCHVSPSYM